MIRCTISSSLYLSRRYASRALFRLIEAQINTPIIPTQIITATATPSGRNFLGSVADLDEHDDSELYRKTDPPLVISGNKIEKGPLDYVVFASMGMGGIEVKNYRTWLYPGTAEVKELLWKCADIGAVPVLMARRVPFITFRLLNLSGCLVYQHYNQLYAVADRNLADLVRDKGFVGVSRRPSSTKFRQSPPTC
jgi:hypothetical protein